jgi:hypothetical protein
VGIGGSVRLGAGGSQVSNDLAGADRILFPNVQVGYCPNVSPREGEHPDPALFCCLAKISGPPTGCVNAKDHNVGVYDSRIELQHTARFDCLCKQLGVNVVQLQARNVMFQSVQGSSSDDPRLPHATTKQFAMPSHLIDERARTN